MKSILGAFILYIGIIYITDSKTKGEAVIGNILMLSGTYLILFP